MKNIHMETIGKYKVGFTASWFSPYVKEIIGRLKAPDVLSEETLGGRRKVDIFELAPGNRIVVKHYARGGIIGPLIKEIYFRWGKVRSQKEFEWLKKVRRLGIRAPEPIAFISKGRLFYSCWLITGEIRRHRRLADIISEDSSWYESIISDLTRQVNILIKNRVLHVDLHPGNVIIDNAGKPYIIDFDKARIYAGSKNKLSRRYISRWRRAVIKHRLDPKLIPSFEMDLLPMA